MPDPMLLAKGQQEIFILPHMSNRHGLIAGATGTGKTVSLQVMAENFSRIGVPVFLADVKGDLAGISQAGSASNQHVTDRLKQLGITDFPYAGCPTVFWDIAGENGHPVRATISEMGPLLLGHLLNLNDTQSGVLELVFRVADDGGLLLLDMKDLRAMLQYVGDNAAQFKTQYGNVSSASIGAIQRGLLSLEQADGDKLFGEPSLDLDDLIQTDANGHGVVNILVADKLIQNPQMYSTFLLWLMSELFEKLPEVGDPDKPKLVFFFDEAHLLFDNAPKALLDKIEQVTRLVRSKGVGIYFISQNPLDIPDVVLGQLGNRVQHALRAFTARDQKAVKAAAETFRLNKAFDIEKAITELVVGEALCSPLDDKGSPCVVDRAFVIPPHSQIGPITIDQRRQIISGSAIAGHYEQVLDRESAYEKLKAKADAATAAAGTAPAGDAPASGDGAAAPRKQRAPAASQRETMMEAVEKSALRAVGSQLGRQISRGLLGSILGGRR